MMYMSILMILLMIQIHNKKGDFNAGIQIHPKERKNHVVCCL